MLTAGKFIEVDMITVKYLGECKFSLEVTGLQGRQLASLTAIVNRPGSVLITEWLSLGIHLYSGLIVPEQKDNADKT